MKKSDREFRFYLEDMRDSMQQIEEYIVGFTLETFHFDRKTIDAVIRNLEIIGEAAKNVPKSLKAKYPEVPWLEMYTLRNKISHEYFGIDYEIIWDVIANYLPENKNQIEEIINNEFLN